MNYEKKYLKYKKKYNELKKQLGGDIWDDVNEEEIYLVFPANDRTEKYFDDLHTSYYVTKTKEHDDYFFDEDNLRYIIGYEERLAKRNKIYKKPLAFAIVRIKFNNDNNALVDNVELYGMKSMGFNPHKCTTQNMKDGERMYTTKENKKILLREIFSKDYYEGDKLSKKAIDMLILNKSEGTINPRLAIAQHLNKIYNYCLNKGEYFNIYEFFDNLPSNYEKIISDSNSESVSEEIKTPEIISIEKDSNEEKIKLENALKANMDLFNQWYDYAVNRLCSVHQKCQMKKINDKDIKKRLEQITKEFETIKIKCENQTKQFKEIHENMKTLDDLINKK